jgi:hypothetical protein
VKLGAGPETDWEALASLRALLLGRGHKSECFKLGMRLGEGGEALILRCGLDTSPEHWPLLTGRGFEKTNPVPAEIRRQTTKSHTCA